MKIAIVGLGKMGLQIAKKIQAAGNDVYGVVRREEQAAELTSGGITASVRHEDALAFFAQDTVVIWLMIPAENVDVELEKWLQVIPAGSIIVDGGNSRFVDTKARAERSLEKGVTFLDIGTSGGVHGLANGFSMMIGGDHAAFETIEPLVKVLAQPTGAYQHFGASGSGHYVKMVHNAIEYGMMQSLAEGYQMLHEGAYAGTIDLAKAGEVWKHGSVVNSWLNDLTVQALTENPTLDGVDGYVAESGEARWTLENAAELGIPLPAIKSSFDVRLASQAGEVSFATKLLAAMRNKFGGHAVNKQ